MALFWKWVAMVGGVAVTGYALLIALSTLLIDWQPRRFDTDVSTNSQPFWDNETRYLMANKHMLAAPANRVIVLGASNTREAFRPALIESHLPGWTAAVAGFGGANMSELGDAVDLIYDELGPKRGRTVFVIGCHYLSFIPSAKLWPNGINPVAAEAARAGLYSRTDNRLVPQLPAALEHAIALGFRPQAVMAHLPRAMGELLLDNPHLPQIRALADRTLRGTDPLAQWTRVLGESPDLNDVNVPTDMKQALLAQRLAGAGGDHPLPPEQFIALEKIIATIRAHGDAVVLAPVPLPRWHIAGVPQAQQSLLAGVDAIRQRHATDPQVGYVSLLDLDDDAQFFDSAHTKPRQWPIWSARVADYLRATVARP